MKFKRIATFIFIIFLTSVNIYMPASAATKKDLIDGLKSSVAAPYLKIDEQNRMNGVNVIRGQNFLNAYDVTSGEADQLLVIQNDIKSVVTVDLGSSAHMYPVSQRTFVLSKLAEAAAIKGMKTGIYNKANPDHPGDIVWYVYDPALSAIVLEYDGDLVTKTGSDSAYMLFAAAGAVMMFISVGSYFIIKRKVEV